MGKIYKKPSADDLKLLDEAMRCWHKELHEAEVRVAVVIVEPPRDRDGVVIGPALKVHGARAAGRIRLVDARQRVFIPYDAEIEIADDFWRKFAREQRLALFDHELEHLVLQIGPDGEPRHHNDGRPILKIQPADYVLSGFVSVADRHKQNALEVDSLKRLCDEHGQTLFPWATIGGAGKKKTKVA